MSDITRKPDCAEDCATLAACVLNQLLALASSIRHLSAIPGESVHVPHLADLAVMHAMEWAEHFEEQAALCRAAAENTEGEQA